jgi:dipicolinate synthase subunit A
MTGAGAPGAAPRPPAGIAVLGGDAREIVMAHLLSRDGHDVATYGLGQPACQSLAASDGLASAVGLEAGSALGAVSGRRWLLCPNPGLGAGDRVYAPFAPGPITLNEDLLRASDVANGGIVLGRASSSLLALAGSIGAAVYEAKDDEALKVRLAASAAEGVLAMLVDRTDQVLRDQRVLVLGYGATGAAIADRLVLLGSQVTVAARREQSLARAEEHGARAVPFGDRAAAMAAATVIVNTVPSASAMPVDVLGGLGDRLIMDIASPPGGTDHASAQAAGIGVLWLRGLVGERAPRTAGELQYRFVKNVIDSSSEAITAPRGSAVTPPSA